jgi:hypothetical protein
MRNGRRLVDEEMHCSISTDRSESSRNTPMIHNIGKTFDPDFPVSRDHKRLISLGVYVYPIKTCRSSFYIFRV